ncbi:hypothetical protein Syun_027593 [Stephania yunnanensis]|uniref:Aminotransferase class I/classII large domain-containing protein n=1 Tax=Stephania yunnanensis TaxID=152371 RepID=A0AAP0HQ33_9MAGN
MEINNGAVLANEEGMKGKKSWGCKANERIIGCDSTIRGTVSMLTSHLNPHDPRPKVPFSQGDPSPFPSFRASPVVEDAIVEALRSAKFNSYSPNCGVLNARRAVAEYLSRDLPIKLSPDQVLLTAGASQAIAFIISVLATPGANILLPQPGYLFYNTRATFSNLECRSYDLLPEQGWEVDINTVKGLADKNTVAMVIINPGNPCGNVYSYHHLKKVAETAEELGILVIADEVYGHIAFGDKPFVPMGVFGSIVPIITIGSLSKRWVVPGWRLGWIATIDPNGILLESKIMESLKVAGSSVIAAPLASHHNIFNLDKAASETNCFGFQGAVPQILERTNGEFFERILNMLRQTSDILVDKLREIDCITCPHKPQGAMFTMVKLNVSLLEDMKDDMEFSIKLAKEESVLVLPGSSMGIKNWLRIMFAIEPDLLKDGLERIKSFCQRHAKLN